VSASLQERETRVDPYARRAQIALRELLELGAARIVAPPVEASRMDRVQDFQ